MARNQLQLREWALRKRDIAVLIVAAVLMSGCSTACRPGGDIGMRPPGGCLDSWECPGIGPNAGIFQVACSGTGQGGWTGCQCVHDGTIVRTLEAPQPVWCGHGSPDGFERIIDANRECGWAMDESAI